MDTLWGVSGRWIELDSRIRTDILCDGDKHEFAVNARFAVDAIRLCQNGRNGLGSSQMHLTGFNLIGDVIGPREIFDFWFCLNSPNDLSLSVTRTVASTEVELGEHRSLINVGTQTEEIINPRQSSQPTPDPVTKPSYEPEQPLSRREEKSGKDGLDVNSGGLLHDWDHEDPSKPDTPNPQTVENPPPEDRPPPPPTDANPIKAGGDVSIPENPPVNEGSPPMAKELRPT
jgi:hypothetical protein